MAILKKTLFAGLAAITLASAGTAVTTTSADAGNRYNNHYNKHYGHKFKYKKHYKSYYNYNHGCYYKKVWRKNYHGYGYGQGHWVKIKICR